MSVLQKSLRARKWFALLFAAVVLADGLACATGPQPMPADPPAVTPLPSVSPTLLSATPLPSASPTSPSPFGAEIDSLVPFTECVMDGHAGVLQRPRSEFYANVPYLSDLTGGVGREISVEQEIEHANRYLVPIFEQIGESCKDMVPPDVEANVLWYTELGKAVAFMTRTGLLSEDMRHNCFEWHRTKANDSAAARENSVARRGTMSGRFYDWHYAGASRRINAACAESATP